ncbi:MAG: T9SS type A sorting domain-containing protein [Bacteroidia bacterium]|nr:T9SS type A sorting domain-containing protein [Bacteroidia bacterium]
MPREQLSTGGSNLMYSIYCINPDTVYIGCDNGSILKTTNGGTDWTFYNVGQTALIKSLFFINADTGFVNSINYSYKTLFYKTLDGGITWNLQDTLPYIEAIYFVNSNLGYGVGQNDTCGVFYKTTDGGMNWTEHIFDDISSLWSIFFINDTIGYVAGNEGSILKTTDGGLNWTYQQFGTYETFNSIYFLNKDTGYVGGNGGCFLRTYDGGLNWTILPINTPDTYLNESGLLSISFPNVNIGFIAIDDMADGAIIRTTDGGNNWEISLHQPARTLFFVNADVGYAIHDYNIYKTTNGGGPVSIKKLDGNNTVTTVFYEQKNNTIHLCLDYGLMNKKPLSFYLYDLLGRCPVYLDNIENSVTTINTKQLHKGVYSYQLKCKSVIINTGKIIID